MEAAEQVRKFQEFVELHYHTALLEKAQKGEAFLVVDFRELSKFDPELANTLLDQPEDTILHIEAAAQQFDLPTELKNFRVRFSSLPPTQKILIRDIRSNHIGKFIFTDGVVRQKSDVRPQVTFAKFECPSCGNIISVPQLDTAFREPSRCGCGRKGKFKLISKEMVDAQRIVLEEAPEELEGGEQPKRMDVFLKQDLVSPLSDKKTNPGSRILIIGTIKEMPITLRSGGQSIRFDLYIEANYVEPMEEEYANIAIAPEEEALILKMAKDPNIYEHIIQSIAPSIYGLDRIKEAIMLQLMGGVHKKREDGITTRGDMHVLLIGDPGAAKSQLLKRAKIIAPKGRYVSGKGASGAGLCVAPASTVLLNPGGMSAICDVVERNMSGPEEVYEGIWRQRDIHSVKIQSISHDLRLHSRNPSAIWKLKAPSHVFSVCLQSGKKIELTGNTSLLTLEQGRLQWKKSSELTEGVYIGTPRRLIGGEVQRLHVVDLIASNPVLHNVKHVVRDACGKLSKKYGSLRKTAEILSCNENNLYHNWVQERSRGNIHLDDFKKLCAAAEMTWKDKIGTVSLYNGKKHRIPVYLNESLLYAAGLLAGDGDIRKSGETISVRLSNSNQTIRKLFESTIKKQFGLSCDIQEGNEKRPAAIRFHSKILGEILAALGIPFSPKSHRIVMSDVLLMLHNRLLAEYLSGLFDADGSVCVREGDNGVISYTTASEKMARQLQLVLLRYEIHSSLRTKPPSQGLIKGKYKKYELEIRGIDNIKKFQTHIPLKYPEKGRKLLHLVTRTKKSNTNVDIIPVIGNIVKDALKKKGIPFKKAGWHKNYSRQALIKVINAFLPENNDLRKLAFSDIFWEKISKIEKKKPGYAYVYDLTVEDSHNFIVDGVLVHNTAAVVKDEFLKGWALEAGALVLANGGFCMIDEMDKMSKEDRDAMHEALEQQTVSISKANIQATLRAETTVLAAANPKLGRFDPYDIISKQIDMPPTLINRFDLIFPIKDLPDNQRDTQLASFILSLHQNKGEQKPALTTSFLRKYVAYARTRIKPRVTDEAVEEIKRYYIEMRSSGSTEGVIKTIPISARQLEALVRLTEANARVRMSNEATLQDAQRAVNLLDYCLREVGLDRETGKIDIDRIATGITASQRSVIVTVKEIVHELEGSFGKEVPIEEVVKIAQEKGIDRDKADETIEKLKRSGDLFEPRRGFVTRI